MKSKASDMVKAALDAGRLEDEAGGFKRRLAKILFQENPYVFDSLEQVRSLIRNKTGNAGAEKRKYAADKTHFAPQQYNFKVPRHEYEQPKTIIIPTALQRIGIISDIHLPFHCEKTIETAYKDFSDSNIQALVLNGDTLDCGEISKHDKSGTEANWSYELDTLYEFLSFTRGIFPDIPIYYKEGNHEARFKHILWRRVPSIAKELDFGEMANLRDFKVTHVQSTDHIQFADLAIYHGHEFRISAAQHPARSLFNRVYGLTNVIIGHLHTTDTFKKGRSVRASVTGCACNLQATYDSSSPYRWNNGYAKATRANKGGHFLENIELEQ